VPGQSDTGRPGRRSWRSLVDVRATSGSVVESAWCDRGAARQLHDVTLAFYYDVTLRRCENAKKTTVKTYPQLRMLQSRHNTDKFCLLRCLCIFFPIFTHPKASGFWVVRPPLIALSVCLSVNTYSAWCDISVLSGRISMKLATSNSHVTGNCWKGFQGHGVRGQGQAATAMEILWTR